MRISITHYAVEKSLDSYKFNLLHCKQTFISQLKSGALGARTIDDGAMDEKSGMGFGLIFPVILLFMLFLLYRKKISKH